MLETAERLVTEEKEPAVQQFLLLVGGLRAMAGARAPGQAGARLLPAALAGGRGLRAVVRPLRAAAGSRVRTGSSTRRPAACCAPPAKLPGSATPAAETVAPARRPARRRLARRRTPPSRATCARPAAWSRRTSPGTSSAACARWRTSSADAELSVVTRMCGELGHASARSRFDGRLTSCAVSTAASAVAAREATGTPPTPHPRARAAGHPRGARARARRDRHGRQRPLGQGARAAPHRRATSRASTRSSTSSRARSRSA